MTVEMTRDEAEILIAVLTGAEAAFAIVNPPLVEALNALRPWRSAMFGAYLRERIGQPVAIDAVARGPEVSTD